MDGHNEEQSIESHQRKSVLNTHAGVVKSNTHMPPPAAMRWAWRRSLMEESRSLD